MVALEQPDPGPRTPAPGPRTGSATDTDSATATDTGWTEPVTGVPFSKGRAARGRWISSEKGGSTSPTLGGFRAAGFTLLEVLIALMILALALSAISYSNGIAMSQVARVTRMTTAAYLMEGVVNDIHAYYVRQGFPANDLEGRPCELPRDFQDVFECRYDLYQMKLEPEVVQALISGGIEQFLGGGAERPADRTAPSAPAAASPSPAPGQPDLSQLAVLAPLFGPDGEKLIQLCNVNLGGILMGMTALVQYLPVIIEQVARQTRKLTVHLTWNDGPRGQREFKVETFVVSLPEEEVQALREAERAREVLEIGRAHV